MHALGLPAAVQPPQILLDQAGWSKGVNCSGVILEMQTESSGDLRLHAQCKVGLPAHCHFLFGQYMGRLAIAVNGYLRYSGE